MSARGLVRVTGWMEKERMGGAVSLMTAGWGTVPKEDSVSVPLNKVSVSATLTTAA